MLYALNKILMGVNFIKKYQILVISKSRKKSNPIGKNKVSVAEEIDSG